MRKRRKEKPEARSYRSNSSRGRKTQENPATVPKHELLGLADEGRVDSIDINQGQNDGHNGEDGNQLHEVLNVVKDGVPEFLHRK